MAFITDVYCHTCGEIKREVVDNNNPHQCGECTSKARTRAEREWKAGREGLSIEERIRDIENFMYHHLKQDHYKGPIVFG